MSTGVINVLAVVDVQSILAGGNRWYVVDDDSSSESEGSQSLETECAAGDILYFRATPITEGQPVTIVSVGPGPGGAFVFGFNQPVNQGNGLWSWQTQNAGRGGYSLGVLVGGTTALTVTGTVHTSPAAQVTELIEKPAASAAGPFQLIDIAVAVNTQAIMAGLGVNDAIFMMDNSPASSGQGTFELNTGCHAGDTLEWHCVAINGIDTVTITGFEQSNGNAFGNNQPSKLGDQWRWTTANPGSNDTYQMRILINGTVPASWDPFVTVQ